MNEKICKTIVEHREQFVPHLFTERQVQLINKWLSKEKMTKTEQTYLYATISKKVDALSLLREEFYITGDHMIPKRVEEAKKILKEINKPAFISGSFLYAEKYKDIDIFIISRRRRSYHKGKKHLVGITEKDLQKPLSLSALHYSIANFSKTIHPEIKREDFDEIVFTYQWVINQIFQHEDQKELRNIVFQYHLQVQGELLDSFSLYKKTQIIKDMPKDKKIIKINHITKELLLITFSKKYQENIRN